MKPVPSPSDRSDGTAAIFPFWKAAAWDFKNPYRLCPYIIPNHLANFHIFKKKNQKIHGCHKLCGQFL